MFNIKDELKKLPEKPGVYIMKDKDDNILYVGKAIILKNRVRQYFQNTPKSNRIKKMISQIDHFEYIVVDSEMEALILECNLIKLHRPKYNVLLKDDKMYPYIKITLNEDFPTVKITRKKLNDGAKYYGPYTNGYAAKETVDFVNKIFKLKQCRKIFKEGKVERACLNYHIKRCLGICQGSISKEEYKKIIENVMGILDGRADSILKGLKNKIEEASKNLKFEKAAEYRDQMNSIENLIQKQKIDNYNENDIDVIGICKKLSKASIEIFFIRNSKMVGGENYILNDVTEESEEDLLTTFIKQYYNESNTPSKIMFKYDFEELNILKEFLSNMSNKKNIEFKIPKKGEKLRFIEMAERNAEISLQNKAGLIEKETLLIELKDTLILNFMPNRIESYDISNISGTDIVAGIVVFEEGKLKKNEYRRIKIKTVEGQDDIACMEETLRRRLKYLVEEHEKNPFGVKPNLILIDGGLNQVNIAKRIIDEFDLNIEIRGMVKNDKHQTRGIIDEDGKEIDISKNEKVFNFVTFVQDEVHKTAIEYHRKIRERKTTKSELDEIQGVGEKKKQALLKHFKSINKIKEASIEELCKIDGINEKIAEKIKRGISSNGKNSKL